MQKNLLVSLVFLVFLIGSTVEASSQHHHRHRRHGFPQKLFVFGDSYADTGNYRKGEGASWKVPYGITFPGKPAGRFSDGRVLTDFLAKYLGLRSPIPHRWRDLKPERQRNGMNFAYGGTGVFDMLIKMPNMTIQIDNFESLLKEGVYSRQDLETSLALVSVAGNDYGAYEASNDTIQGLPSFILSLIDQLHVDLQRLLSLGVRKITVTAIEPLGCLPVKTARLSHKLCDETYNNISIFHNQLLQGVVDQLNNDTSASLVVLLDLYGTFKSILLGRDNKGNTKFENPLKPCCVGTSTDAGCGSVDEKGNIKYKVCKSPNSFFFWDSVHPSEAGWAAVATSLQSTMHFLSQ